MPGSQTATFLDLSVGRYRLALSAEHVLGVVTEARPPVLLRGEELCFCDLSARFDGTSRPAAPFAVCFEAGDARMAIGVDRVDHLRVPAHTALLTVPTFGLTRGQLFRGAIEAGGGLLLVLDAPQLVQLIAPK